MASEFQNQFHEAMREAELADLKKEVDEMASKAQSYAHFDPIDDIRRDLEKAAGPPPDLDTLTDTASSPSASPPPASPPAATEAPPAAAETPPVAAPVEPAAPQSTIPVNTPDAGRAA
jgi:sec-independent protein translocase protein TatB